MSDAQIRPATLCDVPLILMLLKELAVYEKLQDKFHLTQDAIARDLFGDPCHCELAFAGEEPAGIVTWLWTYKSFRATRGLFLEDLYVRPAFRGQGLGRKLLVHLAAKAREGGGFMEWQVLDWNTPSIDFYKSIGATLKPEWITCQLDGDALEKLS